MESVKGTCSINSTAPVGQEKHVGLLDSIDRLQDVNDNLRMFIEKIHNCQSPDKTAEVVRGELSLYDTLCKSPTVITELSESIQSKINELNELLF